MRHHDEDRARAFYATQSSVEYIERFAPEMDSEIRGDMVKAAMYVIYRMDGMDPVFAAMNACRRAPGATNVDRHWSEKSRSRMNNMSPSNLKKIVAMAKKAGISTQGKVYCGGLGRYTDPHAWVSTADDVLTVARQKNYTVTGAINHQGTPVAPPKPVPLASDIVDRHVKRILQQEPSTAEQVRKKPQKMRELKERVIATHAPKKRFHG